MGGKGSSITVGYRYKVMFHMGLSLGPIDAFLEFRCGDQTAWSGELTQSGTISINKPNLFGGDKDQGGIVSDVDVMFGEPTQQPSQYLIATLSSGPLRHLDGWIGLIAELAGAPVDASGNLQLPAGADAHVPAWRGLSTIVFKGGTYGSNNPYPQKASYKIRKIRMGWDGDAGDGSACWYAEKAEIVLAADTILPADADGWDYQTMPQAPNPGTTGLAIPTDGWIPNGRSPFSGGSTQSDGNTDWPVDTTLWLRRTIQIDGIHQTLRAAVDNGCVVFVNGAIIGSSNRADASIDHNERNPVVFPLAAGNTADIAIKCYNEVPPVEPSGVYASISIAASGLTAMNPAHILYYARTQQHMGRRPTAEIDDASHRAAADWFAAQGIGLCWDYDPSQESIDQFIQRIEKVSGCSQSRSPLDGKWYLDIANGEYDLASLPVLTDDDILDFQRQPAPLDSAVNSVSVQYRDPQQKTDVTSPPVQALALVTAFGTIHQDIAYVEIPTGDLAARIAERELRSTTTPTNGFELTATRVAYAWRRGTYFRLQAPKRGIADMVCIIGSIDTGTLKSGAIKITAAQDIYSLPASSFVRQETGVDTRPPQVPLVIMQQAAFEAPYTSVVRALSRADFAALPDDAGYLMTVAESPGNYRDYALTISTDDGSTYDGSGDGPWCPTALIVEGDTLQDHAPTTDFTLGGGALLETVKVGSAALWDNEICRVDAINASATPPTLTLGRGCADTVPGLHAANSRIWFYDGFAGADSTEYTDGETIDVKLLTNSGSSQLDPSLAMPLAVSFAQRLVKPYPPGNLLINDLPYPAVITGQPTLTWVHRDRVSQADQLIDTTQASVGPETGVTYTLRVYDESDSLHNTFTALVGTSYPYSVSDEVGTAGGDSDWSDVVSLLHFDGSAGSTTCTDAAGKTTWSANGGGAELSGAQSQFGGSALALDGASYVRAANPAAIDVSAGPYTIEAWVYLTSISPIAQCLFCASDNNGAISSRIQINSGGVLQCAYSTNAAVTSASGVVTANAWHHIAASLDSQHVLRLFCDGVLAASATIPAQVSGAAIADIGQNTANSGWRINGYVDDFRLTRGVARYTVAFTPPADSFPDAGASALNGRLRFELEAVRDGITSFQHYDVTVRRAGYGFNYGMSYGGKAP